MSCTSCTSVHCRSARRLAPKSEGEEPHAKQTASSKLDLPLPFGQVGLATIQVNPSLNDTFKQRLPTDLNALASTLEMNHRDLRMAGYAAKPSLGSCQARYTNLLACVLCVALHMRCAKRWPMQCCTAIPVGPSKSLNFTFELYVCNGVLERCSSASHSSIAVHVNPCLWCDAPQGR